MFVLFRHMHVSLSFWRFELFYSTTPHKFEICFFISDKLIVHYIHSTHLVSILFNYVHYVHL